MSEQLQRVTMQVDYRTIKGARIERGEVRQGLVTPCGRLVEIHIDRTDERVVFAASECGLPVPATVVAD